MHPDIINNLSLLTNSLLLINANVLVYPSLKYNYTALWRDLFLKNPEVINWCLEDLCYFIINSFKHIRI